MCIRDRLSFKKCVTTYLPSVGATKTDGAKEKYRYFGYMPMGMSW